MPEETQAPTPGIKCPVGRDPRTQLQSPQPPDPFGAGRFGAGRSRTPEAAAKSTLLLKKIQKHLPLLHLRPSLCCSDA